MTTTPIDLARRGRRLEYLTISWNVLEGFIAIGAGIAAGSVALVVFGLDSFIEVASATVVVWELNGTEGNRERTALRLIAENLIRRTHLGEFVFRLGVLALIGMKFLGELAIGLFYFGKIGRLRHAQNCIRITHFRAR